MNTKAAGAWKHLARGTTNVDIRDVYNKAFEYFVIFDDINDVRTTFLIPYQLLGSILNSGYYYDSNYYACKSLSTSPSNISVNTNWTRISKNGNVSTTGTLSVYYR